MSMTDPLGDMLTRIRNAQRAKKSDVVSPASRLRENVLEVLKREGYIAGYEKVEQIRGMDIVICTSAKSDDEAKFLLTSFNLPYKK